MTKEGSQALRSSKLRVNSVLHLLCVNILLNLPVPQIAHLIEWRVTIAPFLGVLRTNSEQYPSRCVEGKRLDPYVIGYRLFDSKKVSSLLFASPLP